MPALPHCFDNILEPTWPDAVHEINRPAPLGIGSYHARGDRDLVRPIFPAKAQGRAYHPALKNDLGTGIMRGDLRLRLEPPPLLARYAPQASNPSGGSIASDGVMNCSHQAWLDRFTATERQQRRTVLRRHDPEQCANGPLKTIEQRQYCRRILWTGPDGRLIALLILSMMSHIDEPCSRPLPHHLASKQVTFTMR